MASTMSWVPSTSGIPVALRSMLGPSALTTASAPATARSMAAASVISPVTTLTSCPQLAGTLPGAGAVTPVKKVLTDIAAKSPRATIYLAGYPELFGNRRAHFSVDQTAPSGSSCVVNPAAAGRVDFADTQFINTRTRQLNDVLRNAVQQAKAAGVKATFVPVGTFDGHGLCDAQASWIQPVLVDSSAVIQPESLHPTRVGQSRGYFRAFQDAGVGASKN